MAKGASMKKVLTNNGGFIVVLLAAGLMVLMCAIAGLAIDVGFAYYVRGEVQNAADAAAFAGADTLMSTPPLATDPNFLSAKSTAVSFVEKNEAAGANLTAANAQIETGYWDLDNKRMVTTPLYACAGSVTTCTPSGANPPGCVCEQRGVPAVRATVQKPDLQTVFAKVVGWASSSPTAVSVAARGYPTSGKVGFPFSVTKCMVDYFMNNNLYGQSIEIPQAYPNVSNCNTGNWSSLSLLNNSNHSDQDILSGKAAATVSLGAPILVQQGVRDNLFNLIQNNYVNQTVVIAVAADNIMAPNTTSTITGFMEFTITGVQKNGPDKYIIGTFNKYYEDDSNVSGIGGPPSNTLSPPVLVK
jgi:Flp pilus assembly protein TadG